ncbi:MAG: RluA family pseudouridine synthase [Acidimicrobiales bacterium]
MTPRTIVESIPDALGDQRVDRIVALVADISRNRAAALVAAGAVTVDGEVVTRPSTRVATGSVLSFTVEDHDDRVVADGTIEVPVVYSDDDVIVVDKPAGLVVHPGSGTRDDTMVNGLVARYPELRSVGESERPGIVHRLDRGTSGLLMVARTTEALDDLGRQLAERTVERRYRTLVAGHLAADGGVVDAPLGRSPSDATRRAVVADGRPARTHYEVLSRLVGRDGTPVTLLACRLETGRTHQIRAHLAAIGHPVVGDPTYGGPVTVDGVVSGRPFLHAERIGFDHPRSGRRLSFDSSLPDDLDDVLSRLRPA